MAALPGTKWALLIGAFAGAFWSLVTWQKPEPPAAPRVATPPAQTEPIRVVHEATKTITVSSSEGTAALRREGAAPAVTLLSSPHEQVIADARELAQAEVRCVEQKDGDACMRAADAYQAGSVVARDEENVKRYGRIARTHYVAGCKAQSSLACQRLSLLYRAGDGVRQSPWTANELLARAKDHCHLRKNRAFCDALAAAGP